MAWWEMAWRGSLATVAMRHRMDAALVGVLLAGSLGFDDGTTWLEPAPVPAGVGKAFVVIAPHHSAHAAPVRLPQLAYAGAPLPAMGPGPRFTISTGQPSAGDAFVAGNRPGGGLALGPQAAPRISAAVPFSLVLGNGPAQLTGGYAGGHSAPAVPEPSTWALVVLGMVMAGGMARRRRKRQPA